MVWSKLKKLKSYESDIWAVGVVKAPIADFLRAPLPQETVWLEPDKSYTYLADPHGVWHEGKLYVFVEAVDYRIKKGILDCFVLDEGLNVLERIAVVEHKTHLSYPFVLKDAGEIYMIPESSRSGETWLYKATDFPRGWEKVHQILQDTPMIDASFIKHNDAWWVFYALPGAENRACRELHVAYAESLSGPWIKHEGNPVSDDLKLSRPGGRPFIHEDKIHLPVQDCSVRYGGSINILRIDALSEERYAASFVQSIMPEFHEKYKDGLHTLSGCEGVTLIDCKYLENSPRRNLINWQRRIMRLFRR